MTTRSVACLLLGLAPLALGQKPAEKDLAQVPTPEVLAIEMAKALVFADRDRFTALLATREEMEQMLEAAWTPSRPEERQYPKSHVAEILPSSRRFRPVPGDEKEGELQARDRRPFELISMAPLYVKDGMKKIRNSRLRMVEGAEGGRMESFLIALDDMFLFPRGWAFTSVRPGIGKEIDTK